MGSDPQSILNWDDQNCKCSAGRERPSLLNQIAVLEKKLADAERVGEAVLDNTVHFKDVVESVVSLVVKYGMMTEPMSTLTAMQFHVDLAGILSPYLHLQPTRETGEFKVIDGVLWKRAERHEQWVLDNLKEPCKVCPANYHTTFDYDKCAACAEKTPFKKK